MLVYCDQCGKQFKKAANKIASTNHNFCCGSCSTTYQNTHKTTGFNRSKLELFLADKLNDEFGHLDILYNDRRILDGLELDIYFPTLNYAIEIEGIVHFKDIFGEERFEQVKRNDKLKAERCERLGITLKRVDISDLSSFNEDSAMTLWLTLREELEYRCLQK